MMLFLHLAIPTEEVSLSAGMVITRSAVVRRAEYLLPNGDNAAKSAALTIRGDGITVDFGGAILRGTPSTTEPNERKGTGIRVEGRNVTLRNLRLHGYKIGLSAEGAHGLKILDSDLSHNWKQRLLSTLEKEDVSDWMSYHHNESDQWLRYGAAIYLRGIRGFEIRGNRVTGGQNALMMTDCHGGLVWNNNFSFLSSAGILLFQSSDNRVLHNRLDWCVRGYSHGVYNRGQDSSGIIIYQQSHRNTFAYNSVTHGGDGFFLWAGQQTMDSGQGGCNDNLIYGNDFSHSPANGIEATFSRNTFVNNLLLDNWHGVWGGFSYDTKILGNVFGMNGEGIAIEHGQRNEVRYNSFHRDHIGAYLWQNERVDPNFGYAKFRVTDNQGTQIEANVFRNAIDVALDLGTGSEIRVRRNHFSLNAATLRTRGRHRDTLVEANHFGDGDSPKPTEGVTIQGNVLQAGGGSTAPLPGVMSRAGVANTVLDRRTQDYLKRFEVGWNPWSDRGPITPPLVREMLIKAPWAASGEPSVTALVLAEQELRQYAPSPLPGGLDPFLKPGTLRGRRYILVDAWGPYDFQSPRLWPRGELGEGGRVGKRFEILGPKGQWRVIRKRGIAELSAESGEVPGSLEAVFASQKGTDIDLVLEYIGEATTDYRGIMTPAGRPVQFGHQEFFLPVQWSLKFFRWTERSNPSNARSTPAEAALLTIFRGEPLKILTSDRLDLMGGVPGMPNTQIAAVGEGTLEVDPGEYEVELTTDDGARVWLDGKPLIEDAWQYQGPTTFRRVVRLGGKHRLRLEWFQIDGYMALKLVVKPKTR